MAHTRFAHEDVLRARLEGKIDSPIMEAMRAFASEIRKLLA
jgi:hypothetical protein